MSQPEQQARQRIDRLLEQAGWVVCSPAQADIANHRGIALREFPLKSGFGFADYLLYVDGKAAGIIEAKMERPKPRRTCGPKASSGRPTPRWTRARSRARAAAAS